MKQFFLQDQIGVFFLSMKNILLYLNVTNIQEQETL